MRALFILSTITMRSFRPILLTSCLLLFTGTTTHAAFSQQHYDFLKANDITTVFAPKYFYPTKKLTQGHAAKFFNQFNTHVLGADTIIDPDCQFTDANTQEMEAHAIIACSNGLFPSTNNRFNYTHYVTKQAFRDNLLHMLGSTKTYIPSNPQHIITRGEAGQILASLGTALLQQSNGFTTLQDSSSHHIPSQIETNPDAQNTVSDGPALTINLLPTTLTTIPSRATSTPIGNIELQANQALALEHITLSITGLINPHYITDISLHDTQGIRKTIVRSFDSERKARLVFNQALELEPNTPIQLAIHMSTNNLQGTFRISIQGAQAVNTKPKATINGQRTQPYPQEHKTQNTDTPPYLIAQRNDNSVITAGDETAISSLELTCHIDDCIMQTLTLVNVSPSFTAQAADDNTTPQTTPNGVPVTLYHQGKQRAQGTLVDGLVLFHMHYLTKLPKNQKQTFIVTVTPPTITDSKQSNQTITLAMLQPGTKAGPNGGYETRIISQANGNLISTSSFHGDRLRAYTQYVRKSAPTLTAIKQTGINKLLAGQGRTIYEMIIDSINGQKVLINQMRRDITTAGDSIQLQDFALRLDNNLLEQEDIQRSVNQGNDCRTATNFDSTNIDASTSDTHCLQATFIGKYQDGLIIKNPKTMSLQSTVTNLGDNNDTLAVRYNTVSTDTTQETINEHNDHPHTLLWSDDANSLEKYGTTTAHTARYTDAEVTGLPLPTRSFDD